MNYSIVRKTLFLWLPLIVVAACSPASIDEDDQTAVEATIAGRWDITVEDPSGAYPSWVEFESAGEGYQGRFVGRHGHARQFSDISLREDRLSFTLPPQYERDEGDLIFRGQVSGQTIAGSVNLGPDRSDIPFTAVPQPSLERTEQPEWGDTLDLLSSAPGAAEEGDAVPGWLKRDPEGTSYWSLTEGVLSNAESGVDILTRGKFDDFKLHIEFRFPAGSNSGVYLRGRYEIQVQDDFGKEAGNRLCGGVYGFITPSAMAVKKAGEWNSYDITLIGRRLTLVFNGQTVIDKQEIPGITGGALDSAEDLPGPLMLQGDHGPIEYRNIQLTPAVYPGS